MTRGKRGRGGKGGHESRIQIRRREELVVRLSSAGKTQDEIAQIAGVSQAAVSKILQRIDERWGRENVDTVQRLKAELIRNLKHVHRESLRAWELSKAQRTRRRQRRSANGGYTPEATVAEVIVEDSHGDPRYLETARRALTDLGRVVGVAQQPTFEQVTDTDGPAVFTMDPGRDVRASTGPSGE